jgi:hypothetical protein
LVVPRSMPMILPMCSYSSGEICLLVSCGFRAAFQGRQTFTWVR